MKIQIYYTIQLVIRALHRWYLSFQKNDNGTNYRSIAVLCGAGIGDAVMATPIIEAIKSYDSNIEITVIANNLNAEIFESNPHISRRIIYKKKSFSLIKSYISILCIKYDVFIGSQPSNTITHNLYAFFSFAKYKIKIDRAGLIAKYRNYDFLYDTLIRDNKRYHRVELNLEIVKSIGVFNHGIEEIVCKMHVSQLYTLRQPYYYTWRTKCIVIHLGGGRKQKIWQIDNYSKIVEYLLEKDVIIIIVGGIEEQHFAAEINVRNPKKIINLIGRLKLNEVSSLLQQSELLITNDSGIMHLAATTNVKIIALFGDTIPSHIGPYTNRSVVIKKDHVKEISVEEVMILIDRCLK
ncbi:MAG: glycosyltransferase family 9 protein [Candidatus Kapabacteria bacterium]|nr:glycosyltransferase family 9 protein [Candidatus Kapabacteria bacterium]